MRRHRERVVRVVDALEQRGTLSGEEIDDVCALNRRPYPNRYGEALALFSDDAPEPLDVVRLRRL